MIAGKMTQARRGMVAAVLSLVLMALPALSCAFLTGGSADVQGTQTAEALIVEQRLKQTLAVELGKRTAQAGARRTESASATERAVFKATADAENQARDEAQATEQAAANATSVMNAVTTEQAASMFLDVQELVKTGILASDQGSYYNLGDFDKNIAKINYMTWWKTGYEPSQFVVRAEISYESASRTANWFNAGCGFVWWDNGVKDNYQVFVALDGNVYVGAYVNDKWLELGKGYYGQPELPAGGYKLELVVNQNNSWVYLDGKMVKKSSVVDASKKTGALSYTLASGTNKDFGTRCVFKNVELWAVAE